MDTVRYTLRCSQSDVTVDAVEPVPGLFVYEQPDELKKPTEINWRIGHHSGLAIAVAIFEEDAIRGAQKIAGLADWTQPAEALQQDVDATELYDALSWASCEHPAHA
ncbi:hypothetical protein [Streptomyces sp. NPDC058254]|uniref:hypothetical protein n=1 Tax=Streptomyces sp. NPDC058254 TaxID=3346406 RepID=UPI0036F0DF76